MLLKTSKTLVSDVLRECSHKKNMIITELRLSVGTSRHRIYERDTLISSLLNYLRESLRTYQDSKTFRIFTHFLIAVFLSHRYK